MFKWILRVLFHIPFRIVFPTRIINKKVLRQFRGKGVVFVCNHRSVTDPPLIFMRFFRRVHFMVKPSVFKTKLRATVMGALDCYPIKKGHDLALIRYCLGKLKKNQAVFLFPEGMRVFNPEDSLALRNGAAMIAIKGNVPIVPMVLKRAPRPFVFNAIKVGQPISVEEYQGKKLEKSDLNDLSDKMKDALAGLLNGFEYNPKPKWWIKEESVVSRAIVVHEDKLLTIKRTKNDEEYYVFPGGHVEGEESARECAVRETREETGVDVNAIRLLYKYNFKGENHGAENDKYGAGMQSFYVCGYQNGEPSKTDADEYTREGDEWGTYKPTWIDLADIKNIDLRPACVKAQLLKDLVKYTTRLTRSAKYVRDKLKIRGKKPFAISLKNGVH